MRLSRRMWMFVVVDLLVGAAAGLGVGFGVWHGSGGASGLPPLRDTEMRVHAEPVVSTTGQTDLSAETGTVSFRVFGLTCGMAWITGTHAEHWARGQLCRVALTANVTSLYGVTIDNRQMALVLAGPPAPPVPMDYESMLVKRQEETVDVGAGNTLTYDLWFDIPVTARPAALRVKINPDSIPVDVPLPPWPLPIPSN